MNYKTCTKCKKLKKIIEFSERKSSRDGLSYHCRECLLKARQRLIEMRTPPQIGSFIRYIENNNIKLSINKKYDARGLSKKQAIYENNKQNYFN